MQIVTRFAKGETEAQKPVLLRALSMKADHWCPALLSTRSQPQGPGLPFRLYRACLQEVNSDKKHDLKKGGKGLAPQHVANPELMFQRFISRPALLAGV